MKSVMSNHFSMIPRADIQRSTFNRSHGYKTTFDAGVLVPIYLDEALPGDTFNVKLTTLARLATPMVPIMDNLHLDFFFFAVPNRLVWDNWQKFMGEQDNPGDSTDYIIPQVGFTDWDFTNKFSGTIVDYFGLPVSPDQIDKFLSVSALPFRAYWLIWNEWFRDENLQESFPIRKDDGSDSIADYIVFGKPSFDHGLAPRNKRHDYFTSCLPWPQKGPGVEIPLGSEADIKVRERWPPVGYNPTVRSSATGVPSSGMESLYSNEGVFGFDDASGVYDPKNTLYADLSSASTVTINSLREAFQLQKLLERDARGGTRYTEILRSHFGVVSPDARLQRPEYLGGGSVAMIINPVAQTSGTASTPTDAYTSTPQGNLAAYGICSSSGHGFTKSFVEHSIIIGMVCARADITYQNGINRMWSRKTRWDFYWPALAHLGEQAVLSQEIYYKAGSTGPNPINDKVFGYQERWAEYRYFPSQITGYFKSLRPPEHHPPSPPIPSLDFWTLSQSFKDTPFLNSYFITDSTKEVLNRTLAVTDFHQILFDSFFDIKCARPMPTYSVPGLMDHF